jgi:hypothetical protein
MQKARGKRHRQGLVLGMILVAGFMTGAWPALGKTNAKDKSGEQPRISVWVFNFARVPDSTLTRAENLATEIFRAAGVEIAWTNCNLATTDLPENPHCDESLHRLHLEVRVLPDIPAVPCTAERPMGVALGDLASVSHRRVREDANDFRVMPQVVLGPVLAHELGHLLLGPNSHSEKGIMRLRWQPEDYTPPFLRGWSFTPEQAQSIRTEVKRRFQKRTPEAAEP